MLSFMPQSPPLPAHASMSNNTMSLAILPSAPMTSYSQASTPTLLAPSPSPAKRPKLSLDTNNVTTTFGKSSTSLRLDSASSPTAKNTFRNAFNPVGRLPGSKPAKPTLKQLSTNIPATRSVQQTTPEATPLIESASSSASISSTSTVDSLSGEVPYKLSYSLTSILTNSPIPRPRPRNSMFSQSKPMFPAAKRVSFKTPLTEEVKNVNFTLRHSDIESSTSTISTLELTPSEQSKEESNDQSEHKKCTTQEPSSPQTGDKRESSDEEDEDSDSTPQTPGPSGRRKRHRQWVWTLGPIDRSTNESDANHKEGDITDEDSKAKEL